jgi:hypothetical protein
MKHASSLRGRANGPDSLRCPPESKTFSGMNFGILTVLFLPILNVKRQLA